MLLEMAPGWHTYWEYPLATLGFRPRLAGRFLKDSLQDLSNGLCRTVCSSREKSRSTPTRIKVLLLTAIVAPREDSRRLR